jgi:hypothetical protein
MTLLAGAGIYHFTRASNPPPAISTPPPPLVAQKPRAPKGNSLVESMAGTRKTPIDRQEALLTLKAKWMQVGNGNDNITAANALALESAELLMCSREMLDLLELLDLHKMEYGIIKTTYAVAELFETARAAEARQLLTTLPETAQLVGERSYQGGGKTYRDKWSHAAGKTCPADQFESFRAALNCKSCATEALYGRNETLMASDPEAAFTSSLEALKSRTPSISGRYGVTRLFEGELPAGIDFAKLEAQLPTDWPKVEAGRPGVEEDAMTAIRSKLFWNWAKIDPAAAANHVMAHPDRLAPGLMEDIVGGYSYKHHNDITAWVSTFPAGPYFDAAARSAAVYARGEPGIGELIQKIQDPKMREEALERARVPLVNPETR